MSIEITYRGFEVEEEGESAQNIKSLMRRDSSWGTFVKLGLSAAEKACGAGAAKRWKKVEPRLKNLDMQRPEDQLFSLTFPSENFNFESEGVDHFIATIAGDILLNKDIKSIEVADVKFKDRKLYEYFPGPNVGLDQLRGEFLSQTLKGSNRPILAFTVKPRLGLSAEDYANLFDTVAAGGIDIVEDDERLIDPLHCPFRDRVDAIARLQERHDTLYSVNITGTFENALDRLEYAEDRGIRMVKFDVLVYGFETLRRIACHIRDKFDSRIAITVYPDAYRAYRRLGRRFILRMSRLCGADIIYAGSPILARYESEGGKLFSDFARVKEMHVLLSEDISLAPHIKRTLPTITNDQHPSIAEFITAFFRKHFEGHSDYAFFVGGGISAFPATLEVAASEWLACITHAMEKDLDCYTQYDLDRYHDQFDKMGWERVDIAKGLGNES